MELSLTQRDYLMKLIKQEEWFKKYNTENLNLWDSTAMTIPQYKKCLALMFNAKLETEEFIKQFFIYESKVC